MSVASARGAVEPLVAVILAAGRGVRLGSERSTPKCLVRVATRPLVVWIVAALARAGVSVAHLVLGHQAEAVERELAGLALPIPCVPTRCPDWPLGNGRSAAHAESTLGDSSRFVLLMGDHIVSAAHVTLAIQAWHANPDDCVLATAPPGSPTLDLADATKVEVDREGRVVAIGKDLTRYTAIDTGVFVMTRSIFDALREAAAENEHSLTAGNRVLARQRRLRTTSIGALQWQDVDTPQDLQAASEIILGGAGRFGRESLTPRTSSKRE